MDLIIYMQNHSALTQLGYRRRRMDDDDDDVHNNNNADGVNCQTRLNIPQSPNYVHLNVLGFLLHI